jgi:signal transduction histidine kinase
VNASFYSFGFKDMRLEPDVEINLYRIAQEALNNVSKHANASSVSVLLENRERGVVLIVEDNGVGFETADKADPGDSKQGLGLLGMRERAVLIGGTIEIESETGKGTTVYVRVGIAESEERANASATEH